MRNWMCGALVAITAASASAARPDPDLGVALDIVEGGAVVVAVSVDGGPARPFLLDTGASRTLLADDIPRAAAMPRLGFAGVASAGRPVVLPRRLAARVTVGPLGATSVPVLVVPRRLIDFRARVDGVLGLDVLALRAFTIDFRGRRLEWPSADDAPAVAAARLSLAVEQGRALVTLRHEGRDAAPLRLVPDTGSTDLVLFDDAGLAMAATPDAFVRLRTLGGDGPARRVRLDVFDIGLVSRRGQPAVLIARPAAWSGAGDGLLPLHWFSRVTFDVPRGVLTVAE